MYIYAFGWRCIMKYLKRLSSFEKVKELVYDAGLFLNRSHTINSPCVTNVGKGPE